MWVFVRTSMNFAHLASFQAIEFLDQPVTSWKTLDISDTKLSLQNAAFCNCCLQRTRTRFNLSHPQSPRFLLVVPSTLTAIAFSDSSIVQESHASFLHLHVSAGHVTKIPGIIIQCIYRQFRLSATQASVSGVVYNSKRDKK